MPLPSRLLSWPPWCLLAVGMAAGGMLTAGGLWLWEASGGKGSRPLPVGVRGLRPSSTVVGEARAVGLCGTIERALARLSGGERFDEMNELGEVAGREDGVGALRLAEGFKNGDDRLHFTRGVLRAMAQQDPAATAAFALSHFPAGALQAEALRIAVGEWGKSDPRAALAWAGEQLSGPAESDVLSAVMRSWAEKSPREAADWLRSEGVRGAGVISSVYGAWAAVDVAAAFDHAAQLDGKAAREAKRAVVAKGATTDPVVTARVLKANLENRPEPVEVVQRGSESKPREDGVGGTDRVLATAERAQALAGGDLRSGELEGAQAVADKEPQQGAVRPKEPVPEAPGEEGLISILTQVWGAADPGAAAQMVDGLPPSAERDEAMSLLATVWAATDIHGAKEWSDRVPVENRGAVIEHLAGTWAATEPLEAREWVQTRPDDFKSAAMESVYDHWAGTDPERLDGWVRDQGDSDEMDVARRSLADAFISDAPERALRIVNGMSAPAARGIALRRYLRHWGRADGAAAQAWLDKEWAALPPVVQEKLSE